MALSISKSKNPAQRLGSSNQQLPIRQPGTPIGATPLALFLGLGCWCDRCSKCASFFQCRRQIALSCRCRRFQILGYRSKSPRWVIAFKYEAEQAVTKGLQISVQVGKTGKLTPVADLTPVRLAGTTVRRHPTSTRQRRIFRLIPQSMTTTWCSGGWTGAVDQSPRPTVQG